MRDKISLDDFITLQRGFDLPRRKRKNGKIPIVASSGIIDDHSEAKVEGPGVVIGRSGSIGGGQFIKEDFWPLNTTLWVRDFKENNPRFVYYMLKSINFQRFNAGAGVPTLNRNHLSAIKVPKYNINTQIEIASILSSYDKLIENNRRRIELLEKSAKLLYKEWFVHLRFPGHEHTNITDGVPEGWEKIHLSEIVSTQYGYTESATEEEIGPKFVRGTDINKTSYIDWSSVPYCPINEQDFKKYELFEGDILAIRMADPGKVALIERKVTAVFASYLIRLKILNKEKYPPLFMFYSLMDNRYQGFISGASTGSTRKSASAKLLTDYDLIVPSDILIEEFINEVLPMRKQIKTLVQQNQKLRKARDLLIPKLMNGDITV